MIIHKPTKITFQTRKEAKMVMGRGRYERLIKNGELEYVNPIQDTNPENLSSYWKVLETGEIFPNRKEAKEKLGMSKYNIMLRTGEIIFVKNENKD